MLVLAFQGDALAECVAEFLSARRTPVTAIRPETVADHEWTVCDGQLKSDGDTISGIFVRCPPHSHFSMQFAEQDQQFADTEIQALLLAASNLPSVFVVNRYGPAAFSTIPSGACGDPC